MPTSPEMETESKKSHRQPTPSESEKRRVKKKLKVAPLEVLPPAVAPPVIVPPAPTPSATTPQDKGKAPAITLVRKSPRLVAGRTGETQEKLMEDAICAAHIVETHQYFPEVSP